MISTAAQPTMLTVARVAGHIGADIGGIDLSEPLTSLQVAEIRTALLAHKVVFFRDQRLTHEQHIAFARHFGTPTRVHPHQSRADEKYPEILVVDPRPDEDRFGKEFEQRYRLRGHSYLSGWHSDITAAVNPPEASVLRAETVPQFGGDTQWTNLVAAYEGLSKPLRDLADGLQAEHRLLAGFHMPLHDPEVAEIVKSVNDDLLIAVHPVVRVIPETGEKALFVNPSSTSRILGVSTSESDALLNLFYAQMTRAEYTVRFRWAADSVAFWDNRTTAHLAAADHSHLNAERRLYRVTLLGERPVGPDGFLSESLAGTPFTAEL